MKGLILKDLINLNKSFRMYAAVLLFFAFIAFSLDDPSYVSSMFTFMFATLTLSSYSYDDYAKWDAYALTMPINKEDIIRGKYMLLFILSGISFLVSSGMSLLLNLIMNKGDIKDGVILTALVTAIALFFYSIIIPLITKLGVEKARIIILVVYAIPFLVGSMLIKSLKSNTLVIPASLISIWEFVLEYAYIIVPMALAVILFISYLISLRIYKKKEF